MNSIQIKKIPSNAAYNAKKAVFFTATAALLAGIHMKGISQTSADLDNSAIQIPSKVQEKKPAQSATWFGNNIRLFSRHKDCVDTTATVVKKTAAIKESISVSSDMQLFEAIRTGDTIALKKALATVAVDAKDAHGFTLAHWAALGAVCRR